MSRTSSVLLLVLMVGVSAIEFLILSTMAVNGSPTGLLITAGVVAAAVAFASLPQLFAPLVGSVRTLRPSERSQFDIPPGEPVKVLAADGIVNAFAAGVLPGNRVVFVTTGLLRHLPAAEVGAIIAHERAHHRRRHVTLRVGSVALFVAPWLVATATGVAGGFYGGLLALGPAILLISWLGRWTEYDADEYAARRVDGRTLASALERVHDDRRLSSSQGGLTALLSTHPPVERRIEKLTGGVAEPSDEFRDTDDRLPTPSLLTRLAGRVLTSFARQPGVSWLTNARSSWENALGALFHAAQVLETAFIRWTGTDVYRASTPYQSLRVVDRGTVRWLILDGDAHSAMDLDIPHRHVFDYTRYFHLPFLFHGDVESVLFIGGGGFTGPKRFLTDYDVTVDVIERDPDVVAAARRFFDVEPSHRLTVHVEDGRQFLQESDRTYDVIVLDAFEAGRVPSSLRTVEFLELARDSLTTDGVLLANIVSAPNGPLSAFYRAECEAMARVFPHVYSFPTVGGFLPQNIELVATRDDELVTPAQLRRRNARGDAGIDLAGELEAYRYVSPTDGERGFRDDDLLDQRE